jgi:hypothetical protein
VPSYFANWTKADEQIRAITGCRGQLKHQFSAWEATGEIVEDIAEQSLESRVEFDGRAEEDCVEFERVKVESLCQHIKWEETMSAAHRRLEIGFLFEKASPTPPGTTLDSLVCAGEEHGDLVVSDVHAPVIAAEEAFVKHSAPRYGLAECPSQWSQPQSQVFDSDGLGHGGGGHCHFSRLRIQPNDLATTGPW